MIFAEFFVTGGDEGGLGMISRAISSSVKVIHENITSANKVKIFNLSEHNEIRRLHRNGINYILLVLVNRETHRWMVSGGEVLHVPLSWMSLGGIRDPSYWYSIHKSVARGT